MHSIQLGGKITEDILERYRRSRYWSDGRFQNLEETKLAFSPLVLPKIIYRQFSGRKEREPKKPISIIPFDRDLFIDGRKTKFIWYGHSAVMLRMNGMTVLIDPMLGPDTSPIGPVSTRRFSENTIDLIDDFPEIDLLLLTHDHYDHLDYASIQKLKQKTKKYFVALGVKRHLLRWGIEESIIHEFEWWDIREEGGISITFTPTRHFSGRGLKDRSKCMWGGWALKTEDENLWFSGDGGYGKHFVEIGERLGPFDFAWMECGQYNEYWKDIHLFPEESVRAASDAKVKRAMPVHWGAFNLAPHPWKEPAERFVRAATSSAMPFVIPQPGRISTLGDVALDGWWMELE